MICDSFALSSSDPSQPIAAADATALLERLRQTEAMWVAFLTRPEDTPYGKANPDRLLALVANAGAWGRAAQVGFHWTEVIGEITAEEEACRVELLLDFSRFPNTPADFVAFHTFDEMGRPVCYLSMAALRAAGMSWQSAAAHEIAEARVNARLAGSVRAPDGTDWDEEVCDSLEGSDCPPPGTSIPLANVAAPRYLGMSDSGPLDIAGAVTKPFEQLPTGYHNGSAGVVQGEKMNPAKAKALAAGGGRTARKEAA